MASERRANEHGTRSVIVIPARHGSSRLPGKPLVDIAGKPMVQHVYERAMQVSGIHAVMVATDDQRVADAVRSFGGNCVMTSPAHASGTERLVEVAAQVDADIYINLQGDEPLVRPGDLGMLVQSMTRDPGIEVGTLYHPIDAHEADNPHTVKVVLSGGGDALYFSRARIPFERECGGAKTARYLKHVGVYGYRRAVLEAYTKLPVPMIEEAEKLEQLRLLTNGFSIRAFEVEPTGPGVDTPACLERVRALITGAPTGGSERAGAHKVTSPTLADIRLVVTDVDGVLTDGGLYYGASGECIKRFHVRDGLGMRMLEDCGVRVAVLSGRDSPALRARIADLGVSLSQLGVKDKATACRNLIKAAGVTSAQTACIGDDSIDLPAFSVCGMRFAVADAPSYVRSAADEVLALSGGQGAFRELADRILLAQGKQSIYSSAHGFSSLMDTVAQ